LHARGQSSHCYTQAEAATRQVYPTTLHLPTATIAAETGFSDPSHFTRAFRARYGMTPGEWRRR